MDRLRSMEYFIASAEEGSFSGAARRLGVSVPAVAKLVNALERRLGVALFDRSAQGLALTATGEAYLAECAPAVEALHALEEQTRAAAGRARGTVVLGVQHLVARQLLAPLLPRLHLRHPEIHLDLRESTQAVDTDAPGVDAYLSFSWADVPDMVHRALRTSGYAVCAAPSYWKARGMPAHPRELERHDCLLIRSQPGTLMDLWTFERGGVTERVTVKGWLDCNNAHGDVAIEMALAGLGVMRLLEWASIPELEGGSLVRTLTDWECTEGPTLYLSYRPAARRLARVRVVMDFLSDALGRPDADGIRPGSAPPWLRAGRARASSLLSRYGPPRPRAKR